MICYDESIEQISKGLLDSRGPLITLNQSLQKQSLNQWYEQVVASIINMLLIHITNSSNQEHDHKC